MNQRDSLFSPAPKRVSEWKDVRIRLPRDLHDKFVEALPMHGAMAWLVREAMTLYLEKSTDSPAATLNRSLEELARALTSGRQAFILSQAGLIDDHQITPEED